MTGGESQDRRPTTDWPVTRVTRRVYGRGASLEEGAGSARSSKGCVCVARPMSVGRGLSCGLRVLKFSVRTAVHRYYWGGWADQPSYLSDGWMNGWMGRPEDDQDRKRSERPRV